MKIRGMTEKFVLREAVRDVTSETVYKRQKHPFLSPPATLNPDQRFSTYVQDTLRGPLLESSPFFDHKKVIALLDELPSMEVGARVANDQRCLPLARSSAWTDLSRPPSTTRLPVNAAEE